MINKNKIVGMNMSPAETQAFFRSFHKKVLTFFGYSSGDYENEEAMLAIARKGLSRIPPDAVLVNIGATASGIGAVYPLAKAMGFTTTGIVSNRAAKRLESISDAADYVCFVTDTQWGGKLPNSDQLSPTSQAMVACSDVLVAIGGGEITRDELIAARAMGKPIYFYPAETGHQHSIQRALKRNEPPPESFWGAAHDEFGKQGRES
ncbi:MAG: hypothetical protein ACM3XO_18890 [Bacteroidota bacterium]